MSINDLFMLGIGVISMAMYAILGLGTTRAVAKMKDREIRMFELFFWPIVLSVIAASGDISD